MKIVTLAEAVKSGRRFRSAGRPTNPKSHRSTTGHWWRNGIVGYSNPEAAPPLGLLPFGVRCAECGEVFSIPVNQPDEWLIEKTEDEFESDALAVLNGLKINVSAHA